MKLIDNLLVLARFTVLIGILIISRLVSPSLTDSALTEQEYSEGDPSKAAEAPAEVPQDQAEASETPVMYASVQVMNATDASGFGGGRRSRRNPALHRNYHHSPGFGNEYFRHIRTH